MYSANTLFLHNQLYCTHIKTFCFVFRSKNIFLGNMRLFFIICFLHNSFSIYAFNEDSVDLNTNQERDLDVMDKQNNHRDVNRM